MRELVLERLAILRARLPTDVTLDDFLWESDVRDVIMPRDWEIAAAYAWLQGVADAEDVLVTQVVEEAEASDSQSR